MTTMRAKMKVSSVEQLEHSEVLTMSAVCKNSYGEEGDDENNTYAKWTPTASLKMHINNPDLHGKFKPGQEFYLDFTPAPVE